jgi:AbrB family looped-hinge helix DNA binding protein
MVMVFYNTMKTTSVPIDQAGRIVLPKNVRQELAIKAGDTLKVSLHGLSITLTPNRETAGFIRKGKALVFTTAGDASLSQEAARRILEETRDERAGNNLAGLSDRRHRE